MARTKKILNEKDLVKYLNNFGIAKNLKFFAGIVIQDPIRKKDLKFKFQLGGDSFTDGKNINIGVPEYLIGHTREEILSVLKTLTGHEAEHINSSPIDLYNEFIAKFIEYFKDKHGINSGIAKTVGAYIGNVIEDGRIERILAGRIPGLLKSIIYTRSLWWNDLPTKEYDPKESKNTEEQQEFFDTLFIFCTFATMGLYPCNYPNIYSEELCDMMRNLKPYIFDAVNSDSYEECEEHMWEAIHEIEDWLVEKMKLFPDSDDFDSKMGDERGNDFGELSEDNTTTSEKLPPKSKKENKSNPLHDAFSDENGGAPPENTDIDGIGDGEDDGKYDSDEKMRKIVDRALKNAEEETYKEMHDAVAEADFDDLAEKKKIEEEEAKSSGTNLTEKELDTVRELYGTLDRSWDVPIKIHRYEYDVLQAPEKVKLDGKKMNKEFEEIFLNKASATTKNKRRGILDTTSLWKLGINDVNVFQKKGRPNETDYVFYLLIDGSGSMSGDKYREALRAASVLEESLSGFAPLKISQFDCGYEGVNHYIIKDFEQSKKGKNYSWTFANHNSADNCNMDGYSIRIALSELRKRTERKKVLIILSDGLPSGSGCYYGREAEQDVKNAIREGRKDHVDIFNIMFGSDRERTKLLPTFKYMYERCIVNCAPEDISKTLLKIVKKELKK